MLTKKFSAITDLSSLTENLSRYNLFSKRLISRYNFQGAFEILQIINRVIEKKNELEYYLLKTKPNLLVETFFEFAFVCFLLNKKKICYQFALKALEHREKLNQNIYPGVTEIYQLLVLLNYQPKSSHEYRKQAYLFRNIGKDLQATANLINTIALNKQKRSLDYSRDCLNLSWLLANQGRKREAFLYARAALVSREEILSQVDPLMIPLYLSLSEIHLKLGNFSHSLFYAKKHLYLSESNLPKNSPSLAEYHLNIALIYQELEELEEAASYIKKALKIYAQNNLTLDLVKKIDNGTKLNREESFYKANLELTLEIQEQIVKSLKEKQTQQTETVSSLLDYLTKEEV